MAQRKHVPQSIEEAVNTLLASLSPDAKKLLRAVPPAHLSERTWWLASWVRNEFGLWDGRSPLLREPLYMTGSEEKDLALGPAHADDVSMAIVQAAWERLRQQAD